MDVNQSQYLFQPELNETTNVWSDVLRIVTPANQPAQQMIIHVIKPMVVGVCATPMTGVAQTYATMDAALAAVAPGGTIKVCPQTIVVPANAGTPSAAGGTRGYSVMKAVTVAAEIPGNKPQFVMDGATVQVGFVVFGSPGRITFRNLSFAMSNNAISAIDIGPQAGPFVPWKDIVVENSVFTMQPNVGRAVRVFGSTLTNPTITIQGNQMSGGTFPIVTLTGSPTSTIEVLSNSFTGVVSSAGVQIQSEANVRVEGNTFSGGGCGANGCISLLNVLNGLVRNNTMTVSNTNPNISGIKFLTSNGTITQNLIVGVSAGGSPSVESSYAFPVGAIVIQPNSGVADPDGVSASTVTVNQNIVTNAVAGVRVVGGGSTVTGSNNVFTNVHSALRLDNTNAIPSSMSVTTSDFTNYFRPILFLGASPAPNTINATCNYWGPLGPQNILDGTPLASYSPWATAPIANGAGGLCNGTSNFTMSASPSSLNVAQGGSNNSTVTIVRTNMTSDIALSLLGLPTGMTGVLTPATLTGPTLTSTLTINVGPTVAVGAYQITVQGIGGSLTRTAVVNVTVSAGSE
jgi:hypothetical protein